MSGEHVQLRCRVARGRLHGLQREGVLQRARNMLADRTEQRRKAMRLRARVVAPGLQWYRLGEAHLTSVQPELLLQRSRHLLV